MVVCGVLSNESDHVLAKPSHVFSDGESKVTDRVHLAENHTRGNSLSKPLNIFWTGKSVCVSLNQSHRQTEVFDRNFWWCGPAVSF